MSHVFYSLPWKVTTQDSHKAKWHFETKGKISSKSFPGISFDSSECYPTLTFYSTWHHKEIKSIIYQTCTGQYFCRKSCKRINSNFSSTKLAKSEMWILMQINGPLHDTNHRGRNISELKENKSGFKVLFFLKKSFFLQFKCCRSQKLLGMAPKH